MNCPICQKEMFTKQILEFEEYTCNFNADHHATYIYTNNDEIVNYYISCRYDLVTWNLTSNKGKVNHLFTVRQIYDELHEITGNTFLEPPKNELEFINIIEKIFKLKAFI